MQKITEEKPPLNLEDLLADEKLTHLRRAYHELEAFQLSPEHEQGKAKLKAILSKSPGDRP